MFFLFRLRLSKPSTSNNNSFMAVSSNTSNTPRTSQPTLRLLVLLTFVALASCCSLPGIPDRQGDTYSVKLYHKTLPGEKPAAVVEQAKAVKTGLRGRLKLKSSTGVTEYKYKTLDSFMVGTAKYIVIPDSIVFPHRAVSPFYKVERQMTDSTLLLSNRSAYDRDYGSVTTSLTVTSATAIAMYAVNNNAPVNASNIAIAAIGAGVAYSLTDFLFRDILVWPTEKYYFEYNTRTRSIRMLRDVRVASLLKQK